MSDDSAVTWVVGAGGLLGQAVCRAAHVSGRRVARSAVPWSDQATALATLLSDADSIVEEHSQVTLMWCAGAGVVGSTPEELEREVSLLDGFLQGLADSLARRGAAELTLFLASSAGGVYAGSEDPPFTERSTPRPISPYGHAKLAAEGRAKRFGEQSGSRLLIGRFANLYGPGQNITKPQGFISQMCRAHLVREPLSIYVSLDTARDYLFASDAGLMALRGTDLLWRSDRATCVTKVMASQASTTLASIIGEMHRLTRRRPSIVLGTNPAARFQTRDLRFRSAVLPGLDPLACTTLPAGISATLRGLEEAMSAARLTG